MENRVKQHYYDMDYLRVFAMICVVYMHAAAGSLRMYLLSANWTGLSILTSLAFCAVPLFFMLSGALILNSERTADFAYVLKKRIPKLLLPLIVWSAVAAAWLTFQSTEGFSVLGWLRKLKAGLHEPVMAHFWFMYTLIGMYLISPILYLGLKHLPQRGRRVLAILLALGMAVATVSFCWPRVGTFLPTQIVEELWFFNGHLYALLMGWLLCKCEKKLPNWLLIALAVLLWGGISVGTYLRTAQTGAYNATFQSQNHGFEILLAMVLFLFCRQNLNRPIRCLSGIVRPLASLSFPVYLLHNIVISVLYAFGLPHERAAHVILATVLVIAVSYLAVKTLATIRPLCYICTGLTYDEACKSCNWIYTVRTLRRKKSNV